jgi:hypothetical protein
MARMMMAALRAPDYAFLHRAYLDGLAVRAGGVFADASDTIEP